jgi:hypothetical protein
MRIVAAVVLSALFPASATAEPLTLLETGSVLRFIDTTAPAVSLRTVTITGLQTGEAITAIDYRPATGLLYGIGVVDGGLSRLYRINTTTGAATLIGGGPFDVHVGLSKTAGLGMDFNPIVDRIRLVNLATGTATRRGLLPASTTQGPMDLAAPGPSPRRRSARK